MATVLVAREITTRLTQSGKRGKLRPQHNLKGKKGPEKKSFEKNIFRLQFIFFVMELVPKASFYWVLPGLYWTQRRRGYLEMSKRKFPWIPSI